jgi:hypothetical protein
MVQSRFRFFGFLPGALFLGLVFIMSWGTGSFMEAPITTDPVLDLIFFLFMFFVLLWLGMGELRTKALAVAIRPGAITVRRFYGLGPIRSYNLSDFDGFTTSLLTSKSDTYEYLYLMKGDKKVLKLSEYYHKNYDDLKAELEKEVNKLGEIPFSLVDEFKEIVK